jgi:superoxide dismutase
MKLASRKFLDSDRPLPPASLKDMASSAVTRALGGTHLLVRQPHTQQVSFGAPLLVMDMYEHAY